MSEFDRNTDTQPTGAPRNTPNAPYVQTPNDRGPTGFNTPLIAGIVIAAVLLIGGLYMLNSRGENMRSAQNSGTSSQMSPSTNSTPAPSTSHPSATTPSGSKPPTNR
jgi:hypothetical protein